MVKYGGKKLLIRQIRACLKIEEVPEFLFQRERFQGGNRKKYCRISRIFNTETARLGQKDGVCNFSNKP